MRRDCVNVLKLVLALIANKFNQTDMAEDRDLCFVSI